MVIISVVSIYLLMTYTYTDVVACAGCLSLSNLVSFLSETLIPLLILQNDHMQIELFEVLKPQCIMKQ